jgi:hypothetical protein
MCRQRTKAAAHSAVCYAGTMSVTSPYRITGERPVDVDPVVARPVESAPAVESDTELPTIACEYDAPPPLKPFVRPAVVDAIVLAGTAIFTISVVVVMLLLD